MADIGNQENLNQAKELLGKTKSIYMKYFGEDYHMLQTVQERVVWVDEKLNQMEIN